MLGEFGVRVAFPWPLSFRDLAPAPAGVGDGRDAHGGDDEQPDLIAAGDRDLASVSGCRPLPRSGDRRGEAIPSRSSPGSRRRPGARRLPWRSDDRSPSGSRNSGTKPANQETSSSSLLALLATLTVTRSTFASSSVCQRAQASARSTRPDRSYRARTGEIVAHDHAPW